MALTKPLFVPVQKTGQAITGAAAFTAPAGTGVQLANVNGPDSGLTLVKASGDATAYVLTRDIVSAADYRSALITEHHVGNSFGDFMTPVKEGEAASAHQVVMAEFEGTDLLDASITNGIAADAEVFWSSGKLALVASGETPCGVVVDQRPVEDSGNAVRILVRFNL